MDESRKITLLTLMIITIVFTFLGSTFAYVNWQTAEEQKTNVVFALEQDFWCAADGGGDITQDDVDIAPASCTNTTHAIQREVTVTPTIERKDLTIYLDLWLNVDNMGTGFSNSDNFMYALTTNPTSCTEGVIASGNFKGKNAGDTVLLLDKEGYSTSTLQTYYLYIWLDVVETSADTMYQSFTLSLGGTCVDSLEMSSEQTTYTITYDANGGSGAPDSESYVYSDTTDGTITLSQTVPTRNYYNFLGWSTDSTATSATYESGDTFIIANDTTLYAVWESTDTISPTCSLSASTSKITATYTESGGSGISYYGWDSTYTGTNSTSKTIATGEHIYYVKDGVGNIGSCYINVTSIGRQCTKINDGTGCWRPTGYGADSNLACYNACTNTYTTMGYVCSSGQTRQCPDEDYEETGYGADSSLACYNPNTGLYSAMVYVGGVTGTMIGTSYCVYK